MGKIKEENAWIHTKEYLEKIKYVTVNNLVENVGFKTTKGSMQRWLEKWITERKIGRRFNIETGKWEYSISDEIMFYLELQKFYDTKGFYYERLPIKGGLKRVEWKDFLRVAEIKNLDHTNPAFKTAVIEFMKFNKLLWIVGKEPPWYWREIRESPKTDNKV